MACTYQLRAAIGDLLMTNTLAALSRMMRLHGLHRLRRRVLLPFWLLHLACLGLGHRWHSCSSRTTSHGCGRERLLQLKKALSVCRGERSTRLLMIRYSS